MHDIGQLSLTDPIPGGATVLVAPADQERIAEYGAEVIREAGCWTTWLTSSGARAGPCRGHDRSQPPPLGSMIIRAANAFDDMVGSSADRSRAAAAMERLRLDTGAEYDPFGCSSRSQGKLVGPVGCRACLIPFLSPTGARSPAGSSYRPPDGRARHRRVLRRG